jgi:PIN domain nuclease of toxin-antitoxin system
MKILVDTHIFLWMLSYPEKLDKKRRYELEFPGNEVFLSAISIAELVIKSSIGKLRIDFDPLDMAQEMLIDILAFSGNHAMTLAQLPLLHKDPFDRMIIAQALSDRMNLMSDDSKFLDYDCPII